MPDPIPFVGTHNQRLTNTGDERYINVVYDVVADNLLGQKQIYCVKRPGFALSQYSTVRTQGRGIFSWPALNQFVQVFDNTISSWNAQQSMSTSSGRCWNVLIPQSTGNEMMIVTDGLDNYNITSTGAISVVDQATHSNYPVSTVGPIVYLDGYVFQAQSNGRLWNSVLNSVSTWSATGFLTADTHAGKLRAIYIQKDQIAAFTSNRTEMFFNNGNPTGSPLLRIDQNTIQVGIASLVTLASAGESACWVGENEGDGDAGRQVFLMQSLSRVKPVSTPPINKLLQAEKSSISSCFAWMERLDGRLLYGIRLVRANRMLCYNLDADHWSEWADTNGNAVTIVSAASLGQQIYLQNNSGQIYSASHSTYQDAGSSFTLRLQTRRMNFGITDRKTQSILDLIADRTTGAVSTYISDDDYQTTTYVGTIDMTQSRKRITRLGGFDERAYIFEYADNSSFRAQAFVPELTAKR